MKRLTKEGIDLFTIALVVFIIMVYSSIINGTCDEILKVLANSFDSTQITESTYEISENVYVNSGDSNYVTIEELENSGSEKINGTVIESKAKITGMAVGITDKSIGVPQISYKNYRVTLRGITAGESIKIGDTIRFVGTVYYTSDGTLGLIDCEVIEIS